MKLFSARYFSQSIQTKQKLFAVVGAGQMGTGIAIVAAMNAKLPVKLMDANKDQIEKSIKFTGTFFFERTKLFSEKLLSGYVEKKKISEGEKEEIKSRIVTTSDVNDLHDADFVVEVCVKKKTSL